jgi:hypothetical protein
MFGPLGGPQQPVDHLDRREAALRQELARAEAGLAEVNRQSWNAQQQPIPVPPPSQPLTAIDVLCQHLVQHRGASPGALREMRDSLVQATSHLPPEVAQQHALNVISQPGIRDVVFPVPQPPPGSTEAVAGPIAQARQSIGLQEVAPGTTVSLPQGEAWRSHEVPDGNSMPFRPHVEDPRIEAARYENASRQFIWGGRH